MWRGPLHVHISRSMMSKHISMNRPMLQMVMLNYPQWIPHHTHICHLPSSRITLLVRMYMLAYIVMYCNHVCVHAFVWMHLCTWASMCLCGYLHLCVHV